MVTLQLFYRSCEIKRIHVQLASSYDIFSLLSDAISMHRRSVAFVLHNPLMQAFTTLLSLSTRIGTKRRPTFAFLTNTIKANRAKI
jgi:hypothetical protein